MPLLPLIALFIAVPFVELYFILQVAGAIGPPYTVLILIGASVAGSLLMRSEGRAAWRRFNRAMREGRMPHTEVLDGILIVFGGAFLITPGFLTDVIGLLLLLPPARAVARRFLVRALGRRLLVGVPGAGRTPAGPGRADSMRGRRGAPGDVDGSAWEERGPREDGAADGAGRSGLPAAEDGDGSSSRLPR